MKCARPPSVPVLSRYGLFIFIISYHKKFDFSFFCQFFEGRIE